MSDGNVDTLRRADVAAIAHMTLHQLWHSPILQVEITECASSENAAAAHHERHYNLPNMRPLNVLLLLARSQPPDPDEELLFLERLAKATPSGRVHFATTRPVAGLTPSLSRVAFYGDASMGYELLGTARFHGFVERGTYEWDIAIQTQLQS